MSKLEHTKEPWLVHFDEFDEAWAIISKDYEGPGTVFIGQDFIQGESNGEADAKRAVICVNAMVGIEDPQQMRETWDIIKHLELDAYDKCKQQRDELLEALKFCKSVIQNNGCFERSEQIAVDKATDLISKIEAMDAQPEKGGEGC